MVALAEAGDMAGPQSIWAQLLLSSAAPSLAAAAPRLLPAYARLGRPDEVLLAARELSGPQMEAAVGRLRRSGTLISAAAIRAVASAYISQRKYYKLGEFVSGAGMLCRRDAGNLLWNLYLLSFAANFKMNRPEPA